MGFNPKSMLFTVKQDLELCKEFKVNPRQLMFIKMLVKNPSMEESAWRRHSYAMSLEFQDVIGLSADELSDLISRNIIVDHNTIGSKVYYDCFEIDPKFTHKFSLKVYPMPAQLEEAYPYYTIIENRRYTIRNASAQEISENYLRGINNDEKEHERILDDIKWAVENKALNIGLKKFVDIKYWNAIRELRKSNDLSRIQSDVTIL